jgi:hypothetical protein
MRDLIETGNWIHGKETAAISGETFPVIDPGRAEVIGTAARGKRSYRPDFLFRERQTTQSGNG